MWARTGEAGHTPREAGSKAPPLPLAIRAQHGRKAAPQLVLSCGRAFLRIRSQVSARLLVLR